MYVKSAHEQASEMKSVLYVAKKMKSAIEVAPE